MKSLIKIYSYLLIGIFIIFPLGSFTYLKGVLFFLFIYLFLIYKFSTGIFFNFHQIMSVLAFLSFILFSILLSFANGFYEMEVFKESQIFLQMFTILFIFFHYLQKNIINPNELVYIATISYIFYIIFKLVIFGLVYLGSLDITFIKQLSRDFVIAFFGNIPRITINNDLFSFVFLCIILINRFLFKNKFVPLFIILIVINIIISFNRTTIISLFLFILLYFILFFRSTFKKFLVFSIISITYIFFAYLLYIKGNSLVVGIINTIIHRFSSEGNLSIGEKLYQYELIFNNIKNIYNFVIGHGIGNFLSEYIRYNIIGYRYGYEAFLGIMLYQFGFLGALFLLIFSNFYFLKKIKYINNKYFLINIFIFNTWILHSVVNPVIISTNSAIIMLVIIANLYSYFYNKERWNHENSNFRNKRDP